AVGGVRAGAGTGGPFTVDDVNAIASQVFGVSAITGMIGGPSTLVYGGKNWMTQVQGVDRGFFDVRDWTLDEGRIFDDGEAQTSAKVAILRKSTAKQLFGDGAPLGQVIRIGSAPFEVIGILSERGQSSV